MSALGRKRSLRGAVAAEGPECPLSAEADTCDPTAPLYHCRVPEQVLTFAFYGLCVAQGLVGWLAFGVSLDGRFDPLVQGAYTIPTIAPVRRLLMSGMAWSLMFACALAWIAPMWTVALTWAGFAFAAANLVVPALMQHGLKGPLWLGGNAWSSLGIRAAVAAYLTWQAPRML